MIDLRSSTTTGKKIPLAHLPAHPFWLLLCWLQQQRDHRRKNKRSIDAPRPADGVRLLDVTFHSPALGRNTQYRVLLPENVPPGAHLPVVYLLHAAGDDFRGWSNDSVVAPYAANAILVMPEGGFSHYVNPVSGPRELYEDFITNDLRTDVENRFPTATDRSRCAVIGLSMGGFGAIHLALSHPDLYAFAAGISSAFNVVERGFSLRRPDSWLMLRRVFGAKGSRTHNERNPFVRLQTLSPATAPFLYLSCGDQDHLMAINRRFVEQLQQLNFPHQFHIAAGSHDWDQWNAAIPPVFQSLAQHFGL